MGQHNDNKNAIDKSVTKDSTYYVKARPTVATLFRRSTKHPFNCTQVFSVRFSSCQKWNNEVKNISVSRMTALNCTSGRFAELIRLIIVSKLPTTQTTQSHHKRNTFHQMNEIHLNFCRCHETDWNCVFEI